MSGRWSRSRSSAMPAVAVAITFMVLIAEKSHTESQRRRLSRHFWSVRISLSRTGVGPENTDPQSDIDVISVVLQ